MSHPAFTPQPQSITALWPVLISRLAEGRRLSWAVWLGKILRWLIARPKVTHPELAVAAGNRIRDHRVANQRPNHWTTEPHTKIFGLANATIQNSPGLIRLKQIGDDRMKR